MLGWAIRRREELEAVRDARMLRGTLNAMIYVQDPKQFADFGEIAEPILPEWMRRETKRSMDEQRMIERQKRFEEAMDRAAGELRGR